MKSVKFRKQTKAFIIFFLQVSFLCASFFASGQTGRKFQKHEVIDVGGGMKAEILQTRGEGPLEEVDVIYYMVRRQEGTRVWQNANRLREEENAARLLKESQLAGSRKVNASSRPARNSTTPNKTGVNKGNALKDTSINAGKINLAIKNILLPSDAALVTAAKNSTINLTKEAKRLDSIGHTKVDTFKLAIQREILRLDSIEKAAAVAAALALQQEKFEKEERTSEPVASNNQMVKKEEKVENTAAVSNTSESRGTPTKVAPSIDTVANETAIAPPVSRPDSSKEVIVGAPDPKTVSSKVGLAKDKKPGKSAGITKVPAAKTTISKENNTIKTTGITTVAVPKNTEAKDAKTAESVAVVKETASTDTKRPKSIAIVNDSASKENIPVMPTVIAKATALKDTLLKELKSTKTPAAKQPAVKAGVKKELKTSGTAKLAAHKEQPKKEVAAIVASTAAVDQKVDLQKEVRRLDSISKTRVDTIQLAIQREIDRMDSIDKAAEADTTKMSINSPGSVPQFADEVDQKNAGEREERSSLSSANTTQTPDRVSVQKTTGTANTNLVSSAAAPTPEKVTAQKATEHGNANIASSAPATPAVEKIAEQKVAEPTNTNVTSLNTTAATEKDAMQKTPETANTTITPAFASNLPYERYRREHASANTSANSAAINSTPVHPEVSVPVDTIAGSPSNNNVDKAVTQKETSQITTPEVIHSTPASTPEKVPAPKEVDINKPAPVGKEPVTKVEVPGASMTRNASPITAAFKKIAEVKNGGVWEKAVIVDKESEYLYKVHYEGNSSREDEWVSITQLRNIDSTTQPSTTKPVKEVKLNGNCSFTAPAPPVSDTEKFSAKLAKRKIYESYVKNEKQKPVKVGVSFTDFETGEPFVNTVSVAATSGIQLKYALAPAGAMVYPVKTKVLLCQQSAGKTTSQTLLANYACFRNKLGGWTCAERN